LGRKPPARSAAAAVVTQMNWSGFTLPAKTHWRGESIKRLP
jgi:hypothetical protein